MNWIKHYLGKIITYYTKPKNIRLRIAKNFINAGVGTLTIIGMVGIVRYSSPGYGDLEVYFSESWPGFTFLGAALLIAGVLIHIVELIKSYRDDALDESYALIVQGLDIDMSNQSLVAIKKEYRKTVPFPVDLLPAMNGRTVINPGLAVETLIRRITAFKENFSGSAGQNATFHFAGLGPGPLLAAAGFLVSNKNGIKVWDYDRDAKHLDDHWYQLDKPATKTQFIEEGVEAACGPEVNLVISITFEVARNSIKDVGPDNLIILRSEPLGNDRLPNNTQQVEFQSRIRRLLNELTNKGVTRVNIYMSCQASLYFRVGQQIDGNHPDVAFYQFTPDEEDIFSWGILIETKKSTISIL